LGKSDFPVWDSGVSSFDSFIVESSKETTQGNMKIQECLKHKKGDRSIKEPKKEDIQV
jgi:hypothetical protein